MENDLRTAILVDGSSDPPAIRVKESERQAYINQGRAGQKPRNFKFVRSVETKVKGEDGEDETRVAYLYRLTGGRVSDEEFEAQARLEADKHLNPEKYMKVTSKPLTTDERAELESLRRIVGRKEG